MQFEARYSKGIAEGSTTLTFRRWKRQQAIQGNTYRTSAGRIVVDSVAVVEADSIRDEDARRAGYLSAADLRADLRGTEDSPVYRVQFHAAVGDDPREQLARAAELSSSDHQEIAARLARLDRASATGPWTETALGLIAENPAVRAGDLAFRMSLELVGFKLNVRKLKNLGLTISLGTGYRLSPRGQAFWQSHAEP